jgi:hypothetical protein
LILAVSLCVNCVECTRSRWAAQFPCLSLRKSTQCWSIPPSSSGPGVALIQMPFGAFAAFLLSLHSANRLVLELQRHRYGVCDNVEGNLALDLQCHPITPQLPLPHCTSSTFSRHALFPYPRLSAPCAQISIHPARGDGDERSCASVSTLTEMAIEMTRTLQIEPKPGAGGARTFSPPPRGPRPHPPSSPSSSAAGFGFSLKGPRYCMRTWAWTCVVDVCARARNVSVEVWAPFLTAICTPAFLVQRGLWMQRNAYAHAHRDLDSTRCECARACRWR